MIGSYTAVAYERPGEREVCKSENLPREGRIFGGTDEPLEGSDKADDDPEGARLPPRSRTEAIPRQKAA